MRQYARRNCSTLRYQSSHGTSTVNQGMQQRCSNGVPEWFDSEVPVLARHLHREPMDAAKVGDYLASTFFFKYETRNYALRCRERGLFAKTRPVPAAAPAYRMCGNESACNYRCVFACALCFKASDDAPHCSQSGHSGKTTLCLQRHMLFS